MNNRGFTTLENVVLIIVFALGLLAMQAYLRRSIQAHWRTNADTVSDEQYDAGGRTTESFINTHPRITGQPQISLGLNPNPSIAGDYSAKTHIGAFQKTTTDPVRKSVVADPANQTGSPQVYTIQGWQAECEGEGCGDDDED